MIPLIMEKYRPSLDTVLEVPHKNYTTKLWNKVKSTIASKKIMKSVKNPAPRARDDQTLASLLKVSGAPLTPSVLSCNNDGHQTLVRAKYIVKQYMAAVGGEKALLLADNLYATGKVRITMSDGTNGSSKAIGSSGGHGTAGFMLWQKKELWCLDLLLSTGDKLVSTGSDGKAPLPWHDSYTNPVPPLPVGSLLQGLNPRLTANLFSNADWFADKSINKEDCFILELVVEPSKLSSSNVEIMRHTILGYFSQKTGLLVKLEDCRQLRLKTWGKYSDWESTMESYFQDYRAIDGVNIAHKVTTCVSLREEGSEGHSRRRKLKLVWELEEVGLDVKGLYMEFFLPRGDLKTKEESYGMVKFSCGAKSTSRIVSPSMRFEASKIVPIDDSDHDSDEEDDCDNYEYLRFKN